MRFFRCALNFIVGLLCEVVVGKACNTVHMTLLILECVVSVEPVVVVGHIFGKML